MENTKKVLLDYFAEELPSEMNMPELPRYVYGQLYDWLVKGADFGEMTNLSQAVRASLAERFVAQPVKILERLTSEGTVKYLYRLTDGNIIEGVAMSYKYGTTLCVSTQVGCRMGCRFCASTIGGLVRNLSAGEILGQVIAVNRDLGATVKVRAVTNIVLMGSGEPLDNYENTVRFIRLVNDERGLNVSQRNISLSTCGLVDGIRRLIAEKLQVNLTLSLHQADNEKRKLIMPVTNAFSVGEAVGACRDYFKATGRRVIVEYTLIENVNDGKEDAAKLLALIKGFPCHVNIIRLNPVAETGLLATSSPRAYAFCQMLTDGGASATVRRQMGVDIEGACGQLRRKYITNTEE